MSAVTGCEDLLYFAYPQFGFTRYLVTANVDGSIPLNAKEGEAITQKCVTQANFANELLAACKAIENHLQRGAPAEEGTVLRVQLKDVIAKAKELHDEHF